MFRYSNSNRTKRRRIIPARQKRDSVLEPPPRIFQNIRVYIHPNNINNSRRKVLHNLIQKNGGSYTLVPDEDTTHVLVDETVSSGKLCRSLGWTTFPPNINVLMVSWLSASVRACQCLNPVDYEIPCTHRPTFATGHHCITSESTAATAPPDNDCLFSDALSSSVLSEDADAEMLNFGYVYEEGSTYDDGKYDDETSCDDQWLYERPTIPSNTVGVINHCNPNQYDSFSTNSFSSASNCGSLLPTLHHKKPKFDNVPPSSRPNTLAAQLSRVRVRRIPEHLRVPGGCSVIVDLNKENIPEASSKNIAKVEANQNNFNTVLNGIQTSSTDESYKKIRMQCKSHLVNKAEAESHYRNQSTKSSTEISEGKSKDSLRVFLPNEQFDVKSVNEVSEVLTKIIESVLEVAVNEKIINESVVEISKYTMEYVDSAKDTLKNENIRTELVSDVLLRVVEDVAKAETNSKNKIGKVESLNKNMDISGTFDVEDTLNIPKDVPKVENKFNASEETQMVIELAKYESLEIVQKNGLSELIEAEPAVSNISLPVSQLPIITDVLPYPIRLFCSSAFNSSALEDLPDNETKPEPIECITSEISHPSNLEPLEYEVANSSNSSPTNNKTSEPDIVNQTRSCGRPDISGPNIFFPFPISSSSSPSSLNSVNSNNPESTGPLFGSCHGPNYEVIKKLQLLYESFKKTGEKWRSDVYEKAIFSLAKYSKPVESLEEIQSLNGMSRKIAQKIWQIRQTGHLEEIDEICVRQSEETRKLFSRAWGISPHMARKLCREGFSTLSDLWTKSNLSRSHLVGLRYYEDFKTKMSKKEATRIFLTVLKVIFEKYPNVQCDACSSLRRNKKFCGHVSILVTLPKGCDKNDHRVLPDIVAKLHQLGYLADDLIRHEENGDQTKYAGIFKLGNSFKYRRIDITVCTREEYACAILFLTGSAYFNRAIQQWAIKREMVLDEHSLRIRLLNTSGGTDAVARLHTPDEKTIFSFLQLPYRTPEQRDRFIM